MQPLESGTQGWPHVQYPVSTAEPLTGRRFCASDLILHYKAIISLLEGTIPGRPGPHCHEIFCYEEPVIFNLCINEVIYVLISAFLWRHTELWSPWTSVCYEEEEI